MTTPADLETMALVAERAAPGNVTDFGSVASVDLPTMTAMVTTSGSSNAVPIRICPHAADAVDGDRVGLTRYGSDWYVTAVLPA